MSTGITRRLAALGSSAGELSDEIESLHDLLVTAIPTTVGLSVTLRISAIDVALTTLPNDATPVTSLRVPLWTWADFEPGSEVVFYASRAGALVDLAAELSWVLELNIAWSAQPMSTMLVLDQHLEPTAQGAMLAGLEDLSAVNKAVGVLLARGSTPDAAVADLQLAAAAAHTSMGVAAALLIADLAASTAKPLVDLSALPVRAPWTGATAPGEHFCGLYRGEQQRDRLLLPFLREGLRKGDKCLCLIDRTAPLDLRRRLLGEADPDGAGNTDDLDIKAAADAYLPDGEFIPADMIDVLRDAAADTAREVKGRLFRATGEMSWALENAPGTEQFFEYESELNRMTGEQAPTLLCLYDLDDLDQPSLHKVLMTHPAIAFDGNVIDSPYYLGPEHNLARR